MVSYNIVEGSIQERFHNSRAKIQLFGGGFGNGKTAAACIKALRLARDYPGSNGLMARETYPKLNDTLRKEFFKWCPASWIKSFSKAENTVVLTNGSIINFRYIAQQGKNSEQSSSNLLSATYDWAVVDQMEDPGITHKDFTDILGRLRGSTPYDPPKGEYDETMPVDGTRWFIVLCNPTRNWLYRKLVKPIHIYQTSGRKHPDLIVDKDTGEPIIELFEGGTESNKHNLPPDFIATMRATYSDMLAKRYIDGEWGAYEGLVYPDYDYDVHVVPHKLVHDYFDSMMFSNAFSNLTIVEGFDYGIDKPCCYMWGYADHRGNVFVVDGIYTPSSVGGIRRIAEEIARVREEYGLPTDAKIYADPQLFKKGRGSVRGAGKTVAELFEDEGIKLIRGDNSIMAGVTKIQGYMKVSHAHEHPMRGEFGAPHVYFSDKLDFLDNELSDYYWQRDTSGDTTEKPMDRNDHACDTLKYMLTNRPELAKVRREFDNSTMFTTWREMPNTEEEVRPPRHH